MSTTAHLAEQPFTLILGGSGEAGPTGRCLASELMDNRVTVIRKKSNTQVLASDIARRLKALRTFKGWTQADLGNRLGRGYQQVSSWENDKTRPPAGALMRLADEEGWPREIFLEDGPMPPFGLRAHRSDDATLAVLAGREAHSPPPYPPEWEVLVALVRDALLAAVERALARDHELEQTKRGHWILGRAFMRLAFELEEYQVDAKELRKVAFELQERGTPPA